jgi:hypothetical protein
MKPPNTQLLDRNPLGKLIDVLLRVRPLQPSHKLQPQQRYQDKPPPNHKILFRPRCWQIRKMLCVNTVQIKFSSILPAYILR